MFIFVWLKRFNGPDGTGAVETFYFNCCQQEETPA